MSKGKVSVIAMKGPPYTFKTTAASIIAKSLRCPVLCVDDILDGLFQHHHHGASSSVPSPEEAERFSLLALDLTCQIAKSFFEQRLFPTVVIDSRLSSPAQADRLINCVVSFCDLSCVVIIIECKPKNTYTWQMRFEDSAVDRRNWYEQGKWYKPNNWDEVDKANLHDFDCDVQSLRSGLLQVSKLVLDPFTALQFLDILEPGKTPLFVDAVQHLMMDKDGGPSVLDFDQWREQLHPSTSISPTGLMMSTAPGSFCRNGHSITKYFDEGFVGMDNCRACEKPITGAAYACDSCHLALHIGCSEFAVNVSFRRDGRLIESFREYHKCSSCVKNGKKRAWECQSCLFESNLKLRLIPTVANHKGHKHFLTLQFMPEESFPAIVDVGFQCMGCGHYVCDRARYYCKLCGFHYELNCVHLPYRRIDEHGGYKHRIRLKFSSNESEDYWCHDCLDKRDPRCWYYSCEQCAYDIHLRCPDSQGRSTPRPAIPFQQMLH